MSFLRLDEDAVICDLAETYHILDYKSLPCKLVATFVSGLGVDARIKSKISGSDLPYSVVIQAAIYDDLQWLVWSKTKDAQHGRNQPKSLLERMRKQEEKEDYKIFKTAEDFAKAWKG